MYSSVCVCGICTRMPVPVEDPLKQELQRMCSDCYGSRPSARVICGFNLQPLICFLDVIHRFACCHLSGVSTFQHIRPKIHYCLNSLTPRRYLYLCVSVCSLTRTHQPLLFGTMRTTQSSICPTSVFKYPKPTEARETPACANVGHPYIHKHIYVQLYIYTNMYVYIY